MKKFIGSIDIEKRVHNKKEVFCYIPKINGIPIMGEFGYIIRYGVNSMGERVDNLKVAEGLLNSSLHEIDSFFKKYYKFLYFKRR